MGKLHLSPRVDELVGVMSALINLHVGKLTILSFTRITWQWGFLDHPFSLRF